LQSQLHDAAACVQATLLKPHRSEWRRTPTRFCFGRRDSGAAAASVSSCNARSLWKLNYLRFARPSGVMVSKLLPDDIAT
jgi:hypothetical protein